MIKVGIISDSPSLTTGFAITCNQIAIGLVEAGYQVVCFGIGQTGENFDRGKFPFKIWCVGQSEPVSLLSKFINYEEPSVIIINFDIAFLQRWIHYLEALHWEGILIGHIVLDGIPTYQYFLAGLHKLSWIVTPTKVVANYLRQNGILHCSIAPHGVDRSVFYPLENRQSLRQTAHIDDKFVVGVFGRNSDRKQQVRVLQALSFIKSDDLVVYFHCQPKSMSGANGWDLVEVARNFNVLENIFFPHPYFEEFSGVPYNEYASTNKPLNPPSLLSNYATLPSNLTYTERLNLCDLIINPAFCGGFELVIIEAQACGIPIAVTNDYSIMAEVAGDGALLLESADVAVWRNGETQYHVAPSAIAEAITAIKRDTALKQQLIKRGLNNITDYSWKFLHDAIIEAIAKSIGETR